MCGALRTFNGDALVVDLGGLGPLLVASVRAPFVAVVREVVLLQPGLKVVDGGGGEEGERSEQTECWAQKANNRGCGKVAGNYCRTSLLAGSSVKLSKSSGKGKYLRDLPVIKVLRLVNLCPAYIPPRKQRRGRGKRKMKRLISEGNLKITTRTFLYLGQRRLR
mgnify:CR=1 FL=1